MIAHVLKMVNTYKMLNKQHHHILNQIILLFTAFEFDAIHSYKTFIYALLRGMVSKKTDILSSAECSLVIVYAVTHE